MAFMMIGSEPARLMALTEALKFLQHSAVWKSFDKPFLKGIISAVQVKIVDKKILSKSAFI